MGLGGHRVKSGQPSVSSDLYPAEELEPGNGPPAFAGVPPPRQDFEPCAYIVGSAASIDSTLALITGPKGFPV